MNNTDTYKIFNESNCIHQEVLWAYKSNTLTDAQKLEVEQHLVDCELCSDALEGFALMATTIGMNEAVEEVKNLTEKKAIPVKQISGRNTWLAAASIAGLLLFGAIAFNLLNEKTEEQKVAQKVSLPPQEPEQNLRAASSAPAVNSDQRFQASVTDSAIVTNSLSREASQSQMEKPALEEKAIEQVTTKAETESVVYTDASASDEAASQIEAPVLNEVSSAAGAVSKRNEAVLVKPQASLPSNRVDNNAANNSNNWLFNKSEDKEERKLALRSEGVINVEGLRVYDYTNEYSSKFKSQEMDNDGVSAQFKDAEEKKSAKSARAKEKVALTYSDALANGLRNFKNKKYDEALAYFEMIKAKHPENANAIFYSALCYEEKSEYDKALSQFFILDRTGNKTFDQETEWHRALISEKKGDIAEAKNAYAKIAATNGFYKDQALDKLRTLK
ncbi:MAG: hypothetical protein IPJ79_16805 [Bacteroidetes bacterium]|nr:hypothetical protein [Bacteroidota bacterium]